MPFAFARIAAVLFAAIALPALALAATIGGAYYAPQYDYRDLWAATGAKAVKGSRASPASRPTARSASCRISAIPAASRPTATEASAEAEA